MGNGASLLYVVWKNVAETQPEFSWSIPSMLSGNWYIMWWIWTRKSVVLYCWKCWLGTTINLFTDIYFGLLCNYTLEKNHSIGALITVDNYWHFYYYYYYNYWQRFLFCLIFVFAFGYTLYCLFLFFSIVLDLYSNGCLSSVHIHLHTCTAPPVDDSSGPSGQHPRVICQPSHFPCGNSTTCIPRELHCNGHEDCANGEDEKACSKLDEHR